ncbi:MULTISPECIES: glycosyltransferase family 2 protein [unclassified Microbacterium]|uniref:glycosyltransferase family 2 protein n=1 Tax=unclassified Microbacterium TaxID=2609290 RepID=UPI0038708116
MPVLNERAYLERAVETVLAQEIDGPTELILALGPSRDGTTELATHLASEDPRITIVHNPEADIPIGLNRAIRAARHDVIVRVDAHSELTAGYARRALETLRRVGAANVGGVMHADGRTPFQAAVAHAYNSRLGLGGGAYHSGGEEGPAESAYLGVMRKEILEEVGLFDESIRRGEDWELNLRLRAAGHLVWFDPALSVTYWPRDSWTRLVRQFTATGTWRGELVRRFGRRNSVRFFAPPALVAATASSIIVAGLQATGVLTGRRASIFHLPIALYVALVAAAGTRAGGPARQRAWYLAVVPSMHLAWGAGFLRGILRGASKTIDTSRLDRNTPLP